MAEETKGGPSASDHERKLVKMPDPDAANVKIQHGGKGDVDALGETRRKDNDVNCGSNKLPAVFIVRDYSSKERFILNISTKKLHAITHPSFEGALCINSKEGWLLMSRTIERGCSLFLLNVICGAKIDLPSVHNDVVGPCTFSVTSGTPDVVIYVTSKIHRSPWVIVRVIHSGDKDWKEYPVSMNARIRNVALAGTQVVCSDREGKVVVLDLSERSLKTYQEVRCSKSNVSVIESDGVALKVDCCPPYFRDFYFTRFDLGVMNWVDLDKRDLENISWFWNNPVGFIRKGNGRKVYTLVPNEYGEPGLPDYETAKRLRIKFILPNGDNDFNVYIHDLADCGGEDHYTELFLRKNSTESLFPTVFRAKHAFWVDVDADLLSGPSSSMI